MKLPLPCFCCGRELVPAIDENEFTQNQPYGATTFHTYGHYGSTVFDPPGGRRRLEINICDSCMIHYQTRIVYVTETQRAPLQEYKDWNPEADN